MPSSWQSPLSLAVGMSWRIRNSGVYFTAEWFAELDQEAIMDPQPFRNQTTGEMVDYQLGLDQRHVINLGLALDHRFSEKFSLYGAFRTDFSSLESSQSSNVLMSTWDVWHFSTGASFQFLGVGFTSGLQYSFGNDTVERFMDFTNTDDGYGEDLVPQTAEVQYRRLKLVIGFDLALIGVGEKPDASD